MSNAGPRTATRRSALAFCVALALVPIAAYASQPAVPRLPARTQCAPRPETASALPVVFEANAGQVPGDVRFVARAAGYRMMIAPSETVISIAHTGAPTANLLRPGSVFASTGAAVSVRLTGANASATVAGVDALEGTANYFVGSDPSRWRTGVPTYGRVRVANVYNGIDAVYYGSDGSVECDYVVAPGFDPGAIAFEIAGASGVALSPDGDLVLATSAGDIALRKPVAYQDLRGRRVAVDAGYSVDGTSVRFRLGDFDHTLPLVIDPVIAYSTYMAGSGDESGASVTVDSAGNTYITGGTSSLDFPVTAGVYSITNAGLTDGFVSKLNASGTGYVYSTYIGGSSDEGIAKAFVDASGNAYVCGGTGSANFPTTAGAYDTTFNGGTYDGFVAKLNSTGTQLLFSTLIGGSGDDGAAGIAVNTAGEVFITGGATSNNYPTTPGAFDTNNTSLLGFPDAVVTKFNSTATALVYSTYLGAGFNLDGGAAIAIDTSGNAFVAGATNGGFPTTSGAFDTSFNGGSFDAFVTKVNPNGNGLVYSTYLGGSGEDYAFSLAVDTSGNAYVTGYTPSTNFPTASPFQPANAGGFDAYVTKLNASGNALVYSSYLGGSGNEGLTSSSGTDLQIAGGIAVDSSGNAYVTGFTDSTDFPVVAAWQPHVAGGFDAWVAKINTTGSAKVYASYLGGALEERGLGIAVDGSGNAYVTGFTLSTNFPTTAGVAQPVAADAVLSNGFLTKVGSGPGDTAGIYVSNTGTWFLTTANAPGPAQQAFTFGSGGPVLVPLAGDWDGNGTVTAGLYDSTTGAFFLTNRNQPGGADLVFPFGTGDPDFVPVVGDWNADGIDTIGIYGLSTGVFFLRNTNDPGPADIVVQFGSGGSGILPLTGDWNGDGTDTIGIYASSTGAFFLKNANTGGAADLVFFYGPAGGVTPVAGDWNGDGTDTIGVYATSTGAWFLKNANAGGAADIVFTYGPASVLPLTGHWGG